MKKKHFSTTFSKMTISFVLLGLLPLLLLGLLFFYRYGSVLKENMLRSYYSMTSYIAKNVGDVVENVDGAMEGIYNYRDEEGRDLGDILAAEDLSEGRRQEAVSEALRTLMTSSDYVSSFRMADLDGRIYALYYSQDKTLLQDNETHTSMKIFREDEDPALLKLYGTLPEDEICANTDDFIFGLARNYMDISSIETAGSEPLATLFADVNVDVIGEIIRNAGIDAGDFYVYNAASVRYIYSEQTEDYMDGRDPLAFCSDYLERSGGYVRVGQQWIFYEPVGDMDIYAVLVLDNSELMGDFFQIRTVMTLILCFAGAFLLLLYMTFSVRMSEPTRQLKQAMEQVEEGNLDVRVYLNTKDEMQYVAEGFNQMVERLEDYIRQVYLAQISQKDAELNALKMQIQPHYLYNTLDVIRMTALDQEDRKTAELLESLARQLRYVMGSQTDRVTVKEELDSIKEYFVLMRARYEGRISLTINLEDEDRDLKIPKMILQPVVENAIRHGLREKDGNGAVGIHVERRERELVIDVIDDGVGMTTEQVLQIHEVLENSQAQTGEAEARISVGMKNVYDRIKLNCGPEYGFTVQSAKGLGTSVTFHLPIWEDA